MKQTLAIFLKGINRSFDIRFGADPERLYTLKNARISKRGNVGFVTRIKGFLQWFSPKEYETTSLLKVKGQVNTESYTKGYRIFINEVINVYSPYHFVDWPGNLPLFDDLIKLEDNFFNRVISPLYFSDTLQITEFFRRVIIPKFLFSDDVELQSYFRVSNIVRIQFNDFLEIEEPFFSGIESPPLFKN